MPAPFGPMIEAISPRPTAIDTSSTARTPPNRFDTAVTVEQGVIGRIDRPNLWRQGTYCSRSFLPGRSSCAGVMAGMMLAQPG